jgi:hypothetical protein
MNNKLVDYKYIDHLRLDKFVEQIPQSHTKSNKFNWKFALSLTGPSIEVGRGATTHTLSTHEKVKRLVDYLLKTGSLSYNRPLELPGGFPPSSLTEHPFILETMAARKVILPSKYTESVNGLKGFAVWISDPAEKDLSASDFAFRGTFVYLTQMHWDNDGLAYLHTGCSALQAVINTANGEELKKPSYEEPLGRGSADHPLVKLERLGAVITDTRIITSLYTVRYMTDEQCYTINGRVFRVNDLLGYPIYIY